jgi:acyl-CoA synthetase (AMP-forming)/AMP-acid ligase II
METLLTLIPEPKALTSGAAIIVPGGDEVSYGDLRASTLHFRDILRVHYGVKTGDVVGMSLVNSLEFVIAFLAIGTARRVYRLSVPTGTHMFVN